MDKKTIKAIWSKHKNANFTYLEFEKLIEYITNICKKHDVDEQLMDFEALIDFSISYQENKEKLEKMVSTLVGETKTPAKDLIEHYEKEATALEEQHYKEEFENAIEEIKEKKTPEIDKYFSTLKELIKITINGENNALCLVSEGGLGKTYQIFKTLSELNLKLNQDYIYISSHITPLELYHILYNHLDKIIILDDVEHLLDNITTIGILKSATWSAVDKRIVNYYTTSEKLKAPSEFEFKGKIIMCLNKIPETNKEIIESLLSRIITYRLKFDYQTKIQIFYEIAKILNIDFELIDFIKENTNEATENLNFRTLIQLNWIYKYYKNNNGDWKPLIKEFLSEKKDDILEVVLELIKSGKSVKEQVRLFKETVGLSERTFYRYKSKLTKLTNCQYCQIYSNRQ